MTRTAIALLAAAGATLASGARAASFSYFIGAGAAPNSGMTYTTFDNAVLGSTTQTTSTGITASFTGGAGFVRGSVPGQYAAPVLTNGQGALFGQADGPDTTTFISTGTGTATLSFANPTKNVSLFWGSVDSFNTLTLFFADGSTALVPGGFARATTNIGQTVYYGFSSATPFTGLSFTSTANSFEFDSIATDAVAAVPEAATWATMIVGLGVVGSTLRRRRAATRVAFG
jgi:hypothetical protein